MLGQIGADWKNPLVLINPDKSPSSRINPLALSPFLLKIKETRRNRKRNSSLSLSTAGEVRETPRMLKIKLRNLKKKQDLPNKKPRTPPSLEIKPRNLKKKQEPPKKKPRKAGTLKENSSCGDDGKPNTLKEEARSRYEQAQEILNSVSDDSVIDGASQDTKDKYYKYLRQVEESECFYVESCYLDITAKLFPCDDVDLARSAAKFALGKHNKDEGKKLDLVRVVRAVMQEVDGYIMWITLEASDHCFYEARTYSQIYEHHCAAHSLYFFRPAKFKQKLESSIDVDDQLEWYNDFSEFVKIDLPFNSFSLGERAEYAKYLKQFMKSECFEVDYWNLKRWRYAQLVKPCSDMALAKSAAEFALDKHNKEKGENLKLESVVRATEHEGDDRYNLWITLKASDHRFYEAKTFSEVMNRNVHSLDCFRRAKYYGN